LRRAAGRVHRVAIESYDASACRARGLGRWMALRDAHRGEAVRHVALGRLCVVRECCAGTAIVDEVAIGVGLAFGPAHRAAACACGAAGACGAAAAAGASRAAGAAGAAWACAARLIFYVASACHEGCRHDHEGKEGSH